MDIITKRKSQIVLFILTSALFIGLYLIQLKNYLLFHVFAEIFSIVIAFSVFIIVWNGRGYLKENKFLILYGLAYLFIGFIDLLHTLGYKGMAIFRDYDYYANQLWIAGRFMESITLMIGAFLISGKRRIAVNYVLLIYTAVTAFFVYSIFFSDIFPECFIAGVGQTEFKIFSEYVIILFLAVTLVLFFRRRSYFTKDTFFDIITSILFTIISEISFIFYIDNYGISNMIGHFAKIISFYYIYRAVIKKNIIEPNDSIFKDLNDANKLKTQLFSIIAHDLTGPMSGMNSIIRTLDDEYDSLSTENKKFYISETRQSHDKINVMLNNLLEWSRLELSGHKIVKQPCNPLSLIYETVSDLETVAELKDIKITLDSESGSVIDIDPVSFKVVIRNILSNAIKFSDKSSIIHIDFDEEASDLIIKIADNGIGMDFDSDALDSPVNKSTEGTSGEKGTGLGLYIISRYTKENGGTLNISSEKGEGTTVILKFPRKS